MSAEENQVSSSVVQIAVSEDRMQAWLVTPTATLVSDQPVSESDVRTALAEHKIAITPNVEQRVGEYATLLAQQSSAEQPEIPERYLVAEGTAPVEPEDSHFEWYESFVSSHKPDDDDKVDYYSLNAIITVPAETAIGTLTQETVGQAGVDVYGRELPPKRNRGSKTELGSGLQENPTNPQEIVTVSAGRIVEEPGRIRLEEVLQVPGDVDFDTGHIDATVNVDIRGAVRSHFSVRSQKSLTVGGTIEAADIDVAGNVTGLKGIVGNQKNGKVYAQGTVTARFVNEAVVQARGGIRIARSTMNSQLYTDNDMLIENGAIVGGQCYACNGVIAKTLGSEAGVKTRIAVGIDPYALAETRDLDIEINQRQKMVDQIRERVQPLMAQLKRLNAQQREKATELIGKADEMELELDEIRARKQSTLSRSLPTETPRVIVMRDIHPGVRISFGIREWKVESGFKGPICIEQRELKGVNEIVAVNKSTGSLTVLRSNELNLEHFRRPDPVEGEPHGDATDATNKQA